MNIYAQEWDKVQCVSLNEGYIGDRLEASKYLVVGQTYTIEKTEVSEWHTTVYLKEFPTIGFNSVFFEDV